MTDSPGPKDDNNRWACCPHCDHLAPHRRDNHDAPCRDCQQEARP